MAADKNETTTSSEHEELAEAEVPAESAAIIEAEGTKPEADDAELGPAHLGAKKYVHAAFFVAGILVAYLSGKVLLMIWNSLAAQAWAVDLVPQLVVYGDDQRETITLAVGAVIGLLAVIQTYRKKGIQRWADDVAAELAKVTWPNKETVQNGTIVVLVASAVATVYITLLDRFWSFLTNLVYGAGS